MIKIHYNVKDGDQPELTAGGVESHGVQILERAAHKFLLEHEQYPVVVADHVDPKALKLSDPSSPLLQLGRAYNAESPSIRPVVLLNDSELECLRQGSLLEEQL